MNCILIRSTVHIGRYGKMVKSEKQRKHLERLNQKGCFSPGWKGGRKQETYDRYIRIYCPSHPYCDKGKYVLEHRLVMEKHLGRVLLPTEVVHHINSIRDDNRIENLMLFSSNGKHMSFELKGKSITWGDKISKAKKGLMK